MKRTIPHIGCYYLGAIAGLVADVSGAFAAPLDWAACREEALARHPQLQAARAAVEQARADLRAAYAPFLPQAAWQGSLGRRGTKTADNDWETTDSYQSSLSAQQSIFRGFSDQARLVQNQALLQAAELELRAAELSVIHNLRNSFLQLLYAEQLITLTKSITDRRADNLRLVELRFEAGREHKGAYLRSRAYYQQAQFDLAHAHRAAATARRTLATALGRSNTNQLEIVSTLPEEFPPPALPDFAALAKATPEYLQRAALLQASEAAWRAARSDYYPELVLGASYGRSGAEWPPDDENWSATLSAAWDLFSGGAVRYAVRKAAAARRQAQAQLVQAENSRLALLEERYHDWQDAAERLAVLNEFLSAAEVRAQIAREQYANGLISFIDWDTIENDLIEKQKNMLAGRRDLGLAKAAWDLATGTDNKMETP